MERAAKAQQNIQLDELQEPGWETPQRVYTVMLLCPYVACAVSICCHVFINLVYSMKFQRVAERHWYYASSISLGLVLLILEFIRAAVMTIVELRKFEIRRRLAGGDFNKSRVRKGADDGTPPWKPRRQFVAKPKLPTAPPKVIVPKSKAKPPLPEGTPPPPGFTMGFPGGPPPPPGLQRPGFLPDEVAGPRPLPVGQPPPPPGQPRSGPGSPSAAVKAVPPIRMQGRTPPEGPSPAGTPIGTPGSRSLLPGRLDGRGTPTLGGTGNFGGTSSSMPPPPPMRGVPGSPSGSVSSFTKPLSEKLAQSRTVTAPPPPGPGSGRGPGPALGGATRGPPAGAPGSAPGSGRSEPPKPPTPPPTGTVQQRRQAARRAQQ